MNKFSVTRFTRFEMSLLEKARRMQKETIIGYKNVRTLLGGQERLSERILLEIDPFHFSVL